MAQPRPTRASAVRAGMLLSSQEHTHSPPKIRVPKSLKPGRAKTKKTIHIDGMFNHPASHQDHGLAPPKHTLSPRPAGVQKSSTKKPGYFSQLHAQKQHLATASPLPISDPDFFAEYRARQSRRSLGITEAIEPYLQDVHGSWQEKLQAQHRSLEAVRKGIDPSTGKKRPAVPTQEDFVTVLKEIEDLERPVEDDMVQLEFERAGRSLLVKNVSLGDLRDNSIASIKRKASQYAALIYKQGLIEAEVAKVKEEIEDNDDIRKAEKEHEARLAALKKEIDQVEAQARADMDQTKKEDRNMTREINRKLRELWDMMD